MTRHGVLLRIHERLLKWKAPLEVFAAIAGAAMLFWNAIRPAWRLLDGDFPNYYTAALLVRKQQALHLFYSWPWFQRQITEAGFGLKMGGYIPQTPLTMLPLIPVSFLPPERARQVWLVLNILFLAVSLVLIARTTRLRFAAVWLIALCSYPALRSNLLSGQYYLLLLALLAFCAYCMDRGHDGMAGVAAGMAAALKLYGLPLALFFIASGRKRAALAMGLSLAACLGTAICVFGWHDVEFFLSIILPRALTGETLDPYNPGNGSAATLIRRLVVREPELNPYPILDNPALFSFIWTGFALTVVVTAILGTRPCAANPLSMRKRFAWWVIAMLLISPNSASYTFALLPLPAALLIDKGRWRRSMVLLGINMLIALPLAGGWRSLFPRFWLLLLAFGMAGWEDIRRIPRRHLAIAMASILVASVCASALRRSSDPPGKPAVVKKGAIYSGSPAASGDEIAFASIDGERYNLHISQGDSVRSISMDGHVFHPALPDSGTPVYFELLQGSGLRVMVLHPAENLIEGVSGTEAVDGFAVSHKGALLATVRQNVIYLKEKTLWRRIATADSPRDLAFSPDDERLVYAAGAEGEARIEEINLGNASSETLIRGEGDLARPVLSPDGAIIAYAERHTGSNWRIRLQKLSDRRYREIAASGCNCYDPTWRPASDELIYATDCRRGVLLPRLVQISAGRLFSFAGRP
jgi:hypothetical protein